MDLGQWVVILLSVILGVWFFVGSVINRRRGMAIFEWLQSGLEKMGGISEAKWIGTSGSGARLVVSKAESPFQRIEVIYLLESREILPLWIFNHLRGKRDEMIIKASLRNTPTQELEAAISGDREFTQTVTGGSKKPFELIQGQGQYEIARRGRANDTMLANLSRILERFSPAIRRVSLLNKSPHLIMRVNLPSLRDKPSAEFFEAVGEWLRDGSA